jgi:hypothetical protein
MSIILSPVRGGKYVVRRKPLHHEGIQEDEVQRWMVANVYRHPPPLPAKYKAGFGEERNFLSSDRKGNAIPRLSRK